jgi:hypothetical protein
MALEVLLLLELCRCLRFLLLEALLLSLLGLGSQLGLLLCLKFCLSGLHLFALLLHLFTNLFHLLVGKE